MTLCDKKMTLKLKFKPTSCLYIQKYKKGGFDKGKDAWKAHATFSIVHNHCCTFNNILSALLASASKFIPGTAMSLDFSSPWQRTSSVFLLTLYFPYKVATH